MNGEWKEEKEAGYVLRWGRTFPGRGKSSEKLALVSGLNPFSTKQTEPAFHKLDLVTALLSTFP